MIWHLPCSRHTRHDEDDLLAQSHSSFYNPNAVAVEIGQDAISHERKTSSLPRARGKGLAPAAARPPRSRKRRRRARGTPHPTHASILAKAGLYDLLENHFPESIERERENNTHVLRLHTSQYTRITQHETVPRTRLYHGNPRHPPIDCYLRRITPGGHQLLACCYQSMGAASRHSQSS